MNVIEIFQISNIFYFSPFFQHLSPAVPDFSVIFLLTSAVKKKIHKPGGSWWQVTSKDMAAGEVPPCLLHNQFQEGAYKGNSCLIH